MCHVKMNSSIQAVSMGPLCHFGIHYQTFSGPLAGNVVMVGYSFVKRCLLCLTLKKAFIRKKASSIVTNS